MLILIFATIVQRFSASFGNYSAGAPLPSEGGPKICHRHGLQPSNVPFRLSQHAKAPPEPESDDDDQLWLCVRDALWR